MTASSDWVLQIEGREPEVFKTKEEAMERIMEEVEEFEDAGCVEGKFLATDMEREDRIECSGISYHLVEWPEGAVEPYLLSEWRDERIAELEKEVKRLGNYIEHLEGRLSWAVKAIDPTVLDRYYARGGDAALLHDDPMA